MGLHCGGRIWELRRPGGLPFIQTPIDPDGGTAEKVVVTRTLSEPRGFYKALVAADSDRILGFTAFAPEAGEVMTIVQIAMNAGLPYMTLRDTILTHPTMAEGLAALFQGVKSQTR